MWLTIAVFVILMLCSCSAYDARAWQLTCRQAIDEKAELADDQETPNLSLIHI